MSDLGSQTLKNIWLVKNSKVISETPWMQVVEDECQVDQLDFSYTYIHKKICGPLVIPEIEPEKLLMVKSYRHPARGSFWQFPVEGMKEGESWKAAAHRGLVEETGYLAQKMTFLQRTFVDMGTNDQQSEFFLAQGLTLSSEVISPHEDFPGEALIEKHAVGVFSLSEIDVLLQEQGVADHWTLSALFVYRRWLDQQKMK